MGAFKTKMARKEVDESQAQEGEGQVEDKKTESKTESKRESKSKDVTTTNIVIVGAGFGGIIAGQTLEKLAKQENVKVTIVDKKHQFQIGGNYQYVLNKRKTVKEITRDLKDVKISDDVEKLWGTEVTKLQVDEKLIHLKSDQGSEKTIKYDYLLLCPGIVSRPDLIPGMKENLYDICNGSQTEKMGDAIRSLQEGTILITSAAVPYKCPPAPFEYAFMIEEMLKKQGVREKCKIILTTPKKPFPFGNAIAEKVFKAAMEKKGIEFMPGIEPINVGENTIEFQPAMGAEGEKKTLNYDLLLGTAPQMPAPIFREPLGNKKGFIPADLYTLETKQDGIFCFGDASWLMLESKPPKPHPKAGAFASEQARNAAQYIECLVNDGDTEALRKKFVEQGREGKCFAESGDDTGILVNAIPVPPGGGPPNFKAEGPNQESFLAKSKWLDDMEALFFN